MAFTKLDECLDSFIKKNCTLNEAWWDDEDRTLNSDNVHYDYPSARNYAGEDNEFGYRISPEESARIRANNERLMRAQGKDPKYSLPPKEYYAKGQTEDLENPENTVHTYIVPCSLPLAVGFELDPDKLAEVISKYNFETANVITGTDSLAIVGKYSDVLKFCKDNEDAVGDIELIESHMNNDVCNSLFEETSDTINVE